MMIPSTTTYTNSEVSLEVEEEKILSVEEVIESYDWDSEVAKAVMMAESHGNPEAYNPESHGECSGSIGLFQIACLHDDKEKLFNEAYNIQRAYELYQEYGWRIWGAYTNKSYLTFK